MTSHRKIATAAKYIPAFLLAALFLANASLASLPAQKSTPTAAAQKFIADMGNEAIDFLGDSNLGMEEKKQRFSLLLDKNFDMRSIARFCMGHHWKNLTPEQQEEYQALFKDLIVSIYSRQFSNYKGQEFRVDSANPSSGTDIMVQSFIIPASGQKIPVGWQLRNKSEGFKIMDVKVEGVSMAITKKSEFASIIQREGGNPESLLKRLREKNLPLKSEM